MTKKKRRCVVCGKDLSHMNFSKVVDKESGLLVTVCSGAKLAIRAHGFLFPSYSRTLVAYTVGEGQTLWEITRRYMDQQDKYRDCRELMHDIAEYNNLNGVKWLQAGQQIVIPLYKEI